MNIDRAAYAVVDLETTGFVPGRHRVVEVAVVAWEAGGEPRVVLDTVVAAPGVRDTFEIHGIPSLLAARAPSFRQISGRLLQCLAGRVVVGHNVGFDLRHLRAELDRLDVELASFASIDTMALDATLFGQGRRSLDAACRGHGIVRRDAHAAGVDATDTARLFRRLLGEARRVGVSTVDELQARLGRRTPAPLLSPMVAEGLPAVPFTPVSRYADLLEREVTVREYSQRLSIALADTSLSEAEAEALQVFREERGLAPDQVRALHAQAFAAAIVMFCQDGRIDPPEAAYLQRLRTALTDAGWAPGDALVGSGAGTAGPAASVVA